MRIDIATLFPEMCERVLDESIIGRARRAGKLDIRCRNIRDYTLDKHRRVDDTPYGGGKGMLMQVEPIYRCWESVCEEIGGKPHTIYLSPKGSVFCQKKAIELKENHENIFLLCGHYEGVDQRAIDLFIDEEISIGDYVLTGGELPAMVVCDCVARYVDGVISPSSLVDESFSDNLLEYPQYTRPVTYRGHTVPEVLRSGNHAEIDRWRREQSLEITKKRRPDLRQK